MPTAAGTMSVDTSQQSTQPAAVDTSLPPAGNAPVTDVAPVNTTSQTNTQPQNANAGEPPASQVPGADGVVAGGVDTKQPQTDEQRIAAYKASREAFLKGEPVPPVETPSQNPPQNPPPGEQSSTQPGAGHLPKMPIRPADAQDQQLLADWKQNGSGKTLREFIFERMQPAPAAKPAGEETSSSEAASTVTLPDGSPAKTTFASVEELDAEIERLNAAKFEALSNFEPSQAREYERQERLLMRKRDSFAQVEQVVQSVEETAFYATWNESLGKAQALFPDAGRPGSALEAKATEIRARWVAQGHPLAHSPDSAVALYAEAQADLGAPAARPTAAPTVSTPPPSIHRPPAMVIAGGDARTIPSGAPVEITPENYHAMKSAYTGRISR